MTPSDLIDRFGELHATEKRVVATLALVGPMPNKSRLASYLSKGGFRSQAGTLYTHTTIDHLLSTLIQMGLVEQARTGEFRCTSAIEACALRVAMTEGTFTKICDAVDAVTQGKSSMGRPHPKNAQDSRMMLRMALLRQRDMDEVRLCLRSFFDFMSTDDEHPYLELFGRPFDPDFLGLLLPQVQEEVLPHLLRDALNRLAPVAPLEQAVQRVLGASPTHTLTLRGPAGSTS